MVSRRNVHALFFAVTMLLCTRVSAFTPFGTKPLGISQDLASCATNCLVCPLHAAPQSSRAISTTALQLSSNSDSNDSSTKFWTQLAATFSQTANDRANYPFNEVRTEKDRTLMNLITLFRVGVPSVIAGIIAAISFPFMSLFLASVMNDGGVFAVLSQDSSQFVQNFLTVTGLLFSILVGQSYAFMYQQQESVYYALFNEVTEAKSLLEQVALVCQGRSMYRQVLGFIQKYVTDDLKQLNADPAVLLSARPVDDPLESIMYMTSVGVPSSVYETVRSLRQARAGRLGALQRKLPAVHFWLLWTLAFIELLAFPLLGAGTQTIGGYNILTVEGCLFGIMTFGIFMTLRVVGELWRPAGGAYNVDGVLSVMVSGLEEELKARMSGQYSTSSVRNYPTPPNYPVLLGDEAVKQVMGEVLPPTSTVSDTLLSQVTVSTIGGDGGLSPTSERPEEVALPMKTSGIDSKAILNPAKKIMSWLLSTKDNN